MNWLAHIFLSENDIDFQIGNYLADPLKARVWENASTKIEQGMKVHTIIDSFTDSHDLFKQSKQRLGTKGLLKAIVIDLTYDYLLTKNWHHFCTQPQDVFLDEFYTKAYERLPSLPHHASQPLKSMIDFDLLNKYQTIEDLYDAFKRVDRRLSTRLKQRDQVIRYYDTITQTIDDIEEDFMNFFPQLCGKVLQHTDNTNLTHWKHHEHY